MVFLAKLSSYWMLLSPRRGVAVPSVTVAVDDVESAVEVARDEVVGVVSGADIELVEDALVLVEVAEFGLEWLEDLDGCHWLVRHGDVPDLKGVVASGEYLDGEEVSREDVLAVAAEAGVRDGGDDFREEILLGWVFWLSERDGGVVADARLPRIKLAQLPTLRMSQNLMMPLLVV